METQRDEIHHLVDTLPDGELLVAKRFLEFLSQESIGPTFAASIRRGMVQADAGQVTVCENYDEMVEKLLGPE